MERALVEAARWLAGERVAVRSRRALAVLVTTSAVALGYAAKTTAEVTAPVRLAPPPPPLPPDDGDTRFGVPLSVRREVFKELAEAEPHARVEGKRSFPGKNLEWSAEDHRGALERQAAARIAARHRITLTQLYLILDEGIRARWPGPDGKPLDPHTVPLHPRRQYGW